MTTVNYPDPGIWTKTSLIQLGYAVWISLPLIGVGMAHGLSTVLDAKYFEKSLADAMTLINPFACILSGVIIDKFGRKKMLIFGEISMMLGWFSIACANSTATIFIGKMVSGIGCGLSLVPPRVYAAELSLPNMRPVVSSCPSIAYSIGILFQRIYGASSDFKYYCVTMTLLTAVLLCSSPLLPESPYFVLITDTEQKTKECVQRFRCKNFAINAEMDELLEFKDDNHIRRLKGIEKVKMMLTPVAFVPFSIIMAYIFLAQMSGVSIFLSWSLEIFKDSNTLIDSHRGKVIQQAIRVIFGIVSAFFLYRYGYKMLSISSGIGIVISCFTLGTLLLIVPGTSIFPQICYFAYVIAETVGYFSLPTILMGELYPLQIRGMLCGLTLSLLNFMLFFTIKLHSFLKHHIGLSSTVFYYGVIALIGCIVLYFIIPDTFNLTLQEIEEYYNHKRPTLVSQRRQMAKELAKVASGKSIKSLNIKKSPDGPATSQLS